MISFHVQGSVIQNDGGFQGQEIIASSSSVGSTSVEGTATIFAIMQTQTAGKAKV